MNNETKEQELISVKQIKLLKKDIDKMSRSEEQFIFILFKNPNGADNITQFSHNTNIEKLKYYFIEALGDGEIRNE